ncbi:MAG: hypothetical protein KGM97_05945 [Alphaproteobacteria bacterium]|nr:hypothetical protein [Alphaproteobacteria bacterium]MDE2630515.1 hypothetical protein [Alphaproteobacteria bacterium]
MRQIFWIAMALLLALVAAEARDAGEVPQGTPNGLALTPPMICNDHFSAMTEETKAILLNKEIITVDQDALGVQAGRMAKGGGSEV